MSLTPFYGAIDSLLPIDSATLYPPHVERDDNYGGLVPQSFEAIIESRKDLTPKGRVIGYFQSVPFYSDEQAVA